MYGQRRNGLSSLEIYSPEVIVNVVFAAIYCLGSSPMDVFLLKLCCALPIQNFHPAGYQIVLLEFMCVESFSAVFLKKKSFSAEDEKKKEGTLYFKRSPMDCVIVGSSGPQFDSPFLFGSAHRE